MLNNGQVEAGDVQSPCQLCHQQLCRLEDTSTLRRLWPVNLCLFKSLACCCPSILLAESLFTEMLPKILSTAVQDFSTESTFSTPAGYTPYNINYKVTCNS